MITEKQSELSASVGSWDEVSNLCPYPDDLDFSLSNPLDVEAWKQALPNWLDESGRWWSKARCCALYPAGHTVPIPEEWVVKASLRAAWSPALVDQVDPAEVTARYRRIRRKLLGCSLWARRAELQSGHAVKLSRRRPSKDA